MSKSTSFIRQSLLHRPCNRHIAGSSSSRTTTSPQRRNVAAPAVTASVKPFNDIPGPIALPLLKHSAHVLPRIGSFHHSVGLGLLEKLRSKYGDLVRLAKATRSRPVLYVFHPEMMREVYESDCTEPPHFDRSPLSQHKKTVSGKCPMHNDETKAIWTGIRMLLQENSILNNYNEAFDDIAADFTRRLGELRHTDCLNSEIETETYRWAIETVGMMIFGVRLGCLDGAVELSPADKNVENHLDTQKPCSLSKRSPEELTPAERLVQCCRQISDGNYLVRSEGTLRTDSHIFSSALKAFDRHYSLTEHFLIKALHTLTSGSVRPEQVLLDKLRPLERRLLPLASDILLAGVDPLAQSALSLFQQLSVQAARQQRAHDETRWAAEAAQAAQAAQGAQTAQAAQAAHPTHTAHSGSPAPPLQYVWGCTREALRIQPVTGGVVRRSTDTLVVAGFEIPVGVDIVLAHGVTSKEEKQWGRAKDFIPERWCNEGWQPLKASRAHPLASMPFGENCPGTGIVGNMLTSLTSKVLEKYRLEWHGKAPSISTNGLNRIEPPYYFVLQKAA